MEVIKYQPPGKNAVKFHQSDAFVRGLMGPVGSGKSSSCCVEIVARALRQRPSNDGIRRSRWLVIRNTYPELKSTTIKTWETWFPANVAPIKWDTPITSTMKISNIGDGTGLELEVMFMALDKPTEEIYRKAEAHAEKRIKEGKSPFASKTELRYPKSLWK